MQTRGRKRSVNHDGATKENDGATEIVRPLSYKKLGLPGKVKVESDKFYSEEAHSDPKHHDFRAEPKIKYETTESAKITESLNDTWNFLNPECHEPQKSPTLLHSDIDTNAKACSISDENPSPPKSPPRNKDTLAQALKRNVENVIALHQQTVNVFISQLKSSTEDEAEGDEWWSQKIAEMLEQETSDWLKFRDAYIAKQRILARHRQINQLESNSSKATIRLNSNSSDCNGSESEKPSSPCSKENYENQKEAKNKGGRPIRSVIPADEVRQTIPTPIWPFPLLSEEINRDFILASKYVGMRHNNPKTPEETAEEVPHSATISAETHLPLDHHAAVPHHLLPHVNASLLPRNWYQLQPENYDSILDFTCFDSGAYVLSKETNYLDATPASAENPKPYQDESQGRPKMQDILITVKVRQGWAKTLQKNPKASALVKDLFLANNNDLISRVLCSPLLIMDLINAVSPNIVGSWVSMPSKYKAGGGESHSVTLLRQGYFNDFREMQYMQTARTGYYARSLNVLQTLSQGFGLQPMLEDDVKIMALTNRIHKSELELGLDIPSYMWNSPQKALFMREYALKHNGTPPVWDQRILEPYPRFHCPNFALFARKSFLSRCGNAAQGGYSVKSTWRSPASLTLSLPTEGSAAKLRLRRLLPDSKFPPPNTKRADFVALSRTLDFVPRLQNLTPALAMFDCRINEVAMKFLSGFCWDTEAGWVPLPADLQLPPSHAAKSKVPSEEDSPPGQAH